MPQAQHGIRREVALGYDAALQRLAAAKEQGRGQEVRGQWSVASGQ